MSIEITSINGMGAVTEASPGVFTTTGMKDDDHMHVVNDFLTGAGVVNPVTDYIVTQKGAGANMSVDISVGTAYVVNSSWSANTNLYTRYWRAVNDATVNVVIGANASGNPRIDIVCLKIDTAVTPDGTASNVGTIVVVAGTPAGSPSAPATPANHLLLAQVAVANGASSIVNANITDRRIIATVEDNAGGWKYSNETWTYASASTFTITGDKTAKYQKGMKIKLTNNSTINTYYIVSVVYSAPNTTITIAGETDLVNSVITGGYYSSEYCPLGFKVGEIWYKAKAYANTTQNLAGNVPTVITANTEIYDINSNYNTSTYMYTAPISGYYLVSGAIKFFNVGANVRVFSQIYNGSTGVVNGTDLQSTGVGSYPSTSVSSVVYAVKGDNLHIRGTATSNESTQIDAIMSVWQEFQFISI